MKTEREREEIIQPINVLLNQAYDSTLDEILGLLNKIDTSTERGKKDSL